MLGRIVGTGIGLALGAGAGYGIYTMAQGVTGACFLANKPPDATSPPNATAEQKVDAYNRNIENIQRVGGECDAQHPVAAAIGNVDPYVTLGGLALVGGILGWIVAGKL